MEHVKSAELPADDAVSLWYWKLLSDVFPYRDTLLYLSQKYAGTSTINLALLDNDRNVRIRNRRLLSHIIADKIC